MKALLFASGTGTRLRPFTHTRMKQLLPVANRPILFFGLDAIVEAGITDVGVMIGDNGDQIRAALGDGSAWGVTLTYIFHETLGVAHGVISAESYLDGDDFLVYLGDVLIDQTLGPLVERFARRGDGSAAQLLVADVDNPWDFGVVNLTADGRIERITEKPAEPTSKTVLVGIYLFDAKIHDSIRRLSPSRRGEVELVEAIQALIDAGELVRFERLAKWYADIGTPQVWLDANAHFLEQLETVLVGEVDADTEVVGPVVVEAGARVMRSRLVGPVIVGSGTSIEGSDVGPYVSIGRTAVIASSHLEHVTVCDEARVSGVHLLPDSIVGCRASVTATCGQPSSKVVLGDDSSVLLSAGSDDTSPDEASKVSA